MTAPPEQPGPVIRSLEDRHGERCVDFIEHADGRVTVKECRRDAEDGGRWTLVADYSARSFGSFGEAFAAARTSIPWLAEVFPASDHATGDRP